MENTVVALKPVFGIDLGSQRIRFARKGDPEVQEDLAVLAIEKNTSNGDALRDIGTNALPYLSRRNFEVVWPLDEGVVKDTTAASALLLQYRRKVVRQLLLFRPFIIVSTPMGASEVEKRAIHDIAEHAFGSTAILIEDLLAAALGAGIDPSGDTPRVLLHMGAGYAAIGVFRHGQITHHVCVRIGGNRLDALIQRHADEHFNLQIDLLMAREIKHTAGSLKASPSGDWSGIATDRDQFTKSIHLTGVEIKAVIESALAPLISELRWFLKKLPADVRQEMKSSGVLMSGGSALLPGIEAWLSAQLETPVIIQTNPASSVIMGIKSMFPRSGEFASLLRAMSMSPR